MISYKLLIIIIFTHLFLISLNANEKETINNNLIIPLNNEIKPQINFSFRNYKILNAGKTLNNDLIDTKEYLKKARGFLAMGVTGVIFTSLAIPASISGTILLWNFAPGIAYTLFFFTPILFLMPFLGIGIPFLVVGFINYRKYKHQKNPDPFVDMNNNNKPYIIGLTFNLNNI